MKKKNPIVAAREYAFVCSRCGTVDYTAHGDGHIHCRTCPARYAFALDEFKVARWILYNEEECITEETKDMILLDDEDDCE